MMLDSHRKRKPMATRHTWAPGQLLDAGKNMHPFVLGKQVERRTPSLKICKV